MKPFLVVGTESDDPFAIDVGRFLGQRDDISDVISLKNFANGEFCPRFIGEGGHRPGYGLAGRHVVVVSTASAWLSRDALAMRTLLVARSAKDNGAERVILVEPDLFYSAQDRGARPDQGRTDFPRDERDFSKFDGQPFSARLYAQALALAGVDRVMTVHNHSASVGAEFDEALDGGYENLSPAPVFAQYLRSSDVIETGDNGRSVVICAPDEGAAGFAEEVRSALGLPDAGLLQLAKVRTDERRVTSTVAEESPCGMDDVAGRDVLIVDDMVRTGGTILECCRRIREGNPRRVVFAVTHFYSSDECRENLFKPFLDEIVTTNSVPTILNRDMQGRLRRKMVVLKLESWIASVLEGSRKAPPTCAFDMSTKHPRWRGSLE